MPQNSCSTCGSFGTICNKAVCDARCGTLAFHDSDDVPEDFVEGDDGMAYCTTECADEECQMRPRPEDQDDEPQPASVASGASVPGTCSRCGTEGGTFPWMGRNYCSTYCRNEELPVEPPKAETAQAGEPPSIASGVACEVCGSRTGEHQTVIHDLHRQRVGQDCLLSGPCSSDCGTRTWTDANRECWYEPGDLPNPVCYCTEACRTRARNAAKGGEAEQPAEPSPPVGYKDCACGPYCAAMVPAAPPVAANLSERLRECWRQMVFPGEGLANDCAALETALDAANKECSAQLRACEEWARDVHAANKELAALRRFSDETIRKMSEDLLALRERIVKGN